MKAWDWPEAPRLLEDIYNFEDVLQVGCILNTFIRRSDVVRIACIAQLVNVIAPIMTEPGGARLAADDLLALPASPPSTAAAPRCNSPSTCPTYDAAAADRVPWLDIAGVHDADAGTLTFFAINRHATETIEADVALERLQREIGRAHDHPPRRSRGPQHARTRRTPCRRARATAPRSTARGWR